jgi:hypothetical protein
MDAKSIQDELKKESQKVMSELQTLRDEIRLKMHLATSEGKDAWNKLEPQLLDFEARVGKAADGAYDDLKNAGSELKANVQKLYQSLRKP